MATIVLCDRTISRQTSRSQLDDVKLSSSVLELKELVSHKLNIPAIEIGTLIKGPMGYINFVYIPYILLMGDKIIRILCIYGVL